MIKVELHHSVADTLGKPGDVMHVKNSLLNLVFKEGKKISKKQHIDTPLNNFPLF